MADEQNGQKLLPPALVAFLVAMATGVLAIFVHALQFRFLDSLSAASSGVMLAGASLLTGALLGLLFGIPRSRAGERSPSGTAGAEVSGVVEASPNAGGDRDTGVGYGANTNLEQISDWLTKILVGVALIELQQIGPAFLRLSGFLAPAVGGSKDALAYTMALMVYFNICGFLGGFLWTRLYLGKALFKADLEAIGKQIAQQAEQVTRDIRDSLSKQSDADARALSLVTRQLEPQPGAPRPTQEDLNAALAAAAPVVKLTAFNQAHKLRVDNWRTDAERVERTIPVFRALIASDSQGKYHRNHAQLGYALKDKHPPDWQGAIDAINRAIEIRGDAEKRNWLFYEFNRALCRIQLDPAFRQGQPAATEVGAPIVADLRSAYVSPTNRQYIDGESTIRDWMAANTITKDVLANP